jgi:organic hydroperoxide reductase OsmC/OhrA
MQDLPHRYHVEAKAAHEGDVVLSGSQLEPISSAPPAEFGGPGDRWSPETLLVAAVADCFILTFRAIARASKLPWLTLQCDVDATLAREDRVTRFTELVVNARLVVAPGVDEARAHRLLKKAESGCLVTNSLNATTHLNATVTVTQ